jgi:hypothetical protein
MLVSVKRCIRNIPHQRAKGGRVCRYLAKRSLVPLPSRLAVVAGPYPTVDQTIKSAHSGLSSTAHLSYIIISFGAKVPRNGCSWPSRADRAPPWAQDGRERL